MFNFFRKRKLRRDRSKALRAALYHFYEDHNYEFPPWLLDFCEGEPWMRMHALPYLIADLREKEWPKESQERIAIELAGLRLIAK